MAALENSRLTHRSRRSQAKADHTSPLLHRPQFLKQLGISASALLFLIGLPSLGLASPARPRQRLIIMFSPNGTIPPAFWPEEIGKDFKLKEILEPLEPFKDRMLILHGIS